MNKRSVYYIAVNAIIAAVYVVLTVAVAPIAYGPVQFRISEILIFLAFYNIRYIPGLILGCFIANLFSPMMAYDVIFGTAATAIAVFGIHYGRRLFKNEAAGLFFGALVGSVVNGLIVGWELKLAFNEPFWFSAGTVALGELAVLVAGALIFLQIARVKSIRRALEGTFDQKG
ncbi:MAG: QueT transporter family protein [Lachnospiraceae bacterium]|nr:QueT transporter family protein [Lachnospiraceae bacterium]